MSIFQSAKIVAMQATHLSKDALHVYVGLGVMFLVVIAFRRSLADWRPIAAVVSAAIAGELWDVIDTYSHGGSQRFGANWKDVWHTTFWPGILFCLARFTKVLKQ